MSNKRNCSKHLFLISLIAMLFASCSPSAPKPNETANVRIEVLSLSTASIVPGTPNPTKYILELIPPEGNGEPIKAESESGTFSVPEVPIGTYTVKITAYDGDNAILEGETRLTVKPNSENKATVVMNYILDGTGILSVTINWTGLTANNQVYTAIHDYKALGFRAVYAEGSNKDKSINGINDPENEKYIFWVDTDKLTSGSYEYRVEGLDPTSGTAIVFQIYTKINGNNQLIAETFPTVMQIYDGLVSKPDQNEGQNFKLDANHIISYLENISNPDYSINEKDPSTSVDITWENPTSLDADNLPFYVLVTAIDNDNSSPTIQVKSDPYEAAGGEGSVTISGLTENHTYNIKFQVIGKEGYSNNTQLLTGVQPKIVVEKIEFVNTPNDSYTMGNSITIEGKISPDNASNKDYKITITEGDEIKKEIDVTASTSSEERTFKFETSGNYKITLTANDNGKNVSRDIKVKLATPTSLQYQGDPSDKGVTISWDPVASADGYKVIRVIDGIDQAIEIDRSNSTTFTDEDLNSRHTYAYKVYAYRTDTSLNSLPTEATTSINVSTADITIIMPESLSEIGNVLSELKGESITIGNEDQIKLVIKNNIAGDAYYEWILNEDFDNPIKEGNFDVASSLIISEEYNLKKNASDGNTTNSLVLRVTVNGNPQTATGYFQVINNNSAGSLTGIKTPESLTNNTVYYGEPIQLEAVFANSSAEKPDVTWISNNPDVMSVDETGKVTTHQKGEPVKITVTVNDTQETKSITLNPYVKAKSLKIDESINPTMYFIAKKTGVTVKDSKYSQFNLGISVIGENDKEPSATPDINFDKDLITLDEEGNIISNSKPGSTNVTISIDELTKSFTIVILDFDIIEGGESITGTNHKMEGSAGLGKDYTVELKINDYDINNIFSDLKLSAKWCFDENLENTEEGLSGSTMNKIISNNISATLSRHALDFGLVKPYARDILVTALIFDNSNSHIATISFTAIGAQYW